VRGVEALQPLACVANLQEDGRWTCSLPLYSVNLTEKFDKF
jgi:hypothetical protein